MQELTTEQFNDVNGAYFGDTVTRILGYAIEAMSKNVGEIDVQGGLALGA